MPSNSGKPRGSLAGFFGAAKPPKSAADDKEALAKSLRASISMPFSVLPVPSPKQNPAEHGTKGKESAEAQQGEHQHLHPAPTHQPSPATDAPLAAADRKSIQKQVDLSLQADNRVVVVEEHHDVTGVSGGGAEGERKDGVGSASSDEEHLGMVAGATVGLPVMDYVPISINEMKRAARKSKAEGGGGKKGKQKGDGPQSISQNTLPRKDKDALKRKYIMGLEYDDGEGSEDEECTHAGKKQRQGQSGRGGGQNGWQGSRQGAGKKRGSHKAGVAADAVLDDSESSSSDDDDEDAVGTGPSRGFSNKHKREASRKSVGAEPASSDSEDGDGASGQERRQADGIVAFDYAAATEQVNKVEKARARRQAQQQGGAGSRGGKRPAFNPYHIPDENLIKAGKRSTVMPRSGNRTMTYK